MKDGMDYAEMLGMPVSSCDVVIRSASKKRRRDAKEDVIAKVNDESVGEKISSCAEAAGESAESEIPQSAEKNGETIAPNGFKEISPRRAKSRREKTGAGREGKAFRFDAVYAEGIAVFALVVAILLTNIFWENSGINVFFRKAFGTEIAATDTRAYTSFSPRSPSSELSVSLDGGVMTFSGKGALYPVCDGEISSVTEENGKYTVTVKHSDVFKTVISGVDYVYAEKGDEVFKYIPVCYVDGDAKVSLYDSGLPVTDYAIENGTILWES